MATADPSGTRDPHVWNHTHTSCSGPAGAHQRHWTLPCPASTTYVNLAFKLAMQGMKHAERPSASYIARSTGAHCARIGGSGTVGAASPGEAAFSVIVGGLGRGTLCALDSVACIAVDCARDAFAFDERACDEVACGGVTRTSRVCPCAHTPECCSTGMDCTGGNAAAGP